MKNVKVIRYIVLGLAIGFMAYGLYLGDAESVWQKAIAICMECIGIG